MLIVELLYKQWKPGKTKCPDAKVYTIINSSPVFTKYFDKVQEQLETLASMDDLISGT